MEVLTDLAINALGSVTGEFITLIIWVIINTLAMVDASLELRDDRVELKRVKLLNDSTVTLIAKRRYMRAWCFILGFSCGACVSYLAMFRNFTNPPTVADADAAASVLRIIITLMIFFFWMAKKQDRWLRRDISREAIAAYPLRPGKEEDG